MQADGKTGQALPCTQVCGAVPMKVLCAGAHSHERGITPNEKLEHLPKAHLPVS